MTATKAQEITAKLMEPFPVDVIEEKNGLLYIPHEIIRERLIAPRQPVRLEHRSGALPGRRRHPPGQRSLHWRAQAGHFRCWSSAR